ncbi:MAG: VacJ family lipoprotein, partial [Paracoccaceae bacterium]|nr:VacJ family lipoprotein [Paracoccaceae bacterium]
MPVSVKIIAAGLVAAFLGGCAGPEVTSDVYDPLEPMNRGVHEFNKGVDKIVLRPSSQAYGSVVPEPVRNRFSDLSTHLSTPSAIVNDVLQLNLVDAMHNTTRFLANTIFGLGGLFDPATS